MLMWKSFHPQENMIREFNLNELFQKSKKLSKGRGMKEEEQNEDGSNELHLNENLEQQTESKKDQWGEGGAGSLLNVISMLRLYCG